MKTKTYENQAEQQLNHALTHIGLAVEALGRASASCDDFPSARHELTEMKEKAAKIKKDIEELSSELDRKKTR